MAEPALHLFDPSRFAEYEAVPCEPGTITPEVRKGANRLLLEACKAILPFVAEDFEPGFKRAEPYRLAYEQLHDVVAHATGKDPCR